MEKNDIEGWKTTERKEGDPRIHFNIFYGPHRTPEDFKGFEIGLRQADIYFPENAGWDKETETAYALIAKGEHDPGDLKLDDPILRQELETLYKLGQSGKILAVRFIDIPENNPLFSEIAEVEEEKEEVKDTFEHGYFDEALENIKRVLAKDAQVQAEREEYMKTQIHSKISEILESYPQLKEKVQRGEELNIFLTLGTFHTKIFHDFKQRGEKANRSFKRLPTIFNFGNEMLRRNVFGKEVTNELAARTLIELEISPCLEFLEDSERVLRVLRKIVSKFSLNDIKEISTRLGNGDDIINIFQSFQVQIPRSEADVDRMLSE